MRIVLAACLIGWLLGLSRPAVGQVEVDAKYTADWLRNTRGGLRQASAYLQNVDIQGAWVGASGARAFAHLLYNDASLFSENIVGDAQIVSNIEAPEAWRVLELWHDEPIGERWRLKLGLYDLNSEFDAIEAAALFLNSSHGIGIDFAQSGVRGPSIFPETALGMRVAWRASERQTVKVAVIDGVPKDADGAFGESFDLGGDEGVLGAVEWTLQTVQGRVGFGYWRYSAELDYAGEAGSGRGSDGAYGFVERAVEGWAGQPRWFLRYGRADEDFNEFGEYFGAGLIWSPGETSSFGVALARAATGSGLPGARDSAETVLEATYRRQIKPWLWVQPDVQYIRNPGANPGLDDALAVGVRLELALALYRAGG